jgi:sulfate adenylyltransferase large subunit
MAKETLKIVIVGHVDHGKSTMIGRLLLDTNSLPKEKLAEIRKISKELGKDTELAYLTDQLKEERERNITIDTTQIFFKTRKRDYVIIDAPGHVEFLKNMITGATQAEAAVLIVDVNEGMMEQTGRHAYLISMLGIDKVIIVFNKMDVVGYKEERFNSVKNKLTQFMQELGVTPTFMIPISAREGDNISRKSTAMSWYKGPILLHALDSLRLRAKVEQRPLRFPVQDVYEVDTKRILVGKVVSGLIEVGQDVVFLPSLRKTKVKSIEVFEKEKKSAAAEENIGMTLNESMPEMQRGEVIVHEKDQPQPTDRFEGNIFWMVEEPLKLNNPVTLRCATQEVTCAVEQIKKRINSSTLEVIEENARELGLNEAGTVVFKAERPIVVEKYSFIDELGRFVIERDYQTQGAGIIS